MAVEAADSVSVRVRAEGEGRAGHWPQLLPLDMNHAGTSVSCVPPFALKMLYLSYLKI